VGRVGPGYDREAQAFQRAQAEADRFFAPLFASAIDRAPVAAEAFDLLDELPPVAETWGPAGALLRFLPDSQWEQGIDRIRRVIEPLVKSHEVLERGWAPVL